MLLNSLTDWGNIRCWYRDTIWTYLQVIMNSHPSLSALLSFQPTYRCSYYVFIRKSWLTQLTKPNSYFITTHFFATTHRMLFACFFDSPTRQKCPKKTRNLRKAWCCFGSLANLVIFFLPQILLPKRFTKKQRLGNHVQKNRALLNLGVGFESHFSGLQPLGVFFLRYPLALGPQNLKNIHRHVMNDEYLALISHIFVSI